MLLPTISPPNVPIPDVEPTDTMDIEQLIYHPHHE